MDIPKEKTIGFRKIKLLTTRRIEDSRRIRALSKVLILSFLRKIINKRDFFFFSQTYILQEELQGLLYSTDCDENSFPQHIFLIM